MQTSILTNADTVGRISRRKIESVDKLCVSDNAII